MEDNQRRSSRSRFSRVARGAAGRWLGLVVLGVGSCVVPACAKAKAASVPDGPPLAMPVPPPRVLAPIDEPLATNPTPDTPVNAPRPITPPRPAPRRPATATTQPEPPPEPVAQQPAPVAPEPARPAAPPQDAAAERRVRDVLARASRDLGRVDYRRLTANGREQYEQSKRFSDQTEQALRERNYVFAATLADKAAALATELLARR